VKLMGYRCACISLLLAMILGGEGQAQEDPYFEWLKQQDGQQQPAPVPATPFPQPPPPIETPAPVPPPVAQTETHLVTIPTEDDGSSRITIVGAYLEDRHTDKNGVLTRISTVPVADIDVVEIGYCGMYVIARSKTVRTTYFHDQSTKTGGAALAVFFSDESSISESEANAAAQKIASSVGVRLVDVGDDDCW
jgi:hypothetical protein